MTKTQTKTNRVEFPRLLKKTATGDAQFWDIAVERTQNDTGVIVVCYGRLGTASPTTLREEIREGKNAGRKNATTPYEQAVLEAEAKWKKQKDRKGYGLTLEESATVRGSSPMLALDFKKVKDIDWSTAYGQPKLDGFRCKTRREGKKLIMLSRENKPITTMDHVAEQAIDCLADGQDVDGELYSHGMPFQQIASLVKRKQPDSSKIQLHLYDMVLSQPFATRTEQLGSLVGTAYPALQLVETVMLRSKEQLMFYQQHCIAEGYEGAMLRHGKQGYEPGKRSKHLLKVKTFQDAEFVVVAATEGRGTHAGMAVFTCRTDDGNRFDVLSPGTHVEKRRYWAEHRKYIGKRLTVKFQDWTTTEMPVPRFPAAVRFAESV